MGLKPGSFAAGQIRFKVESLRTSLVRLIGSEIGRETIGSLGLKAANTGLAFLGTVVLARVLEPAGYGVYAYIYALVTLLAVPAQFGMPTLVLRETARGSAQGDYGAVQGIWRWAGRSTAVISLGLVGAAALVAWALRAFLAYEGLATLAWGLVLVPLVALGNLRGAALRGLNRVVAGQLPELLLRPGLLVLLVAGAAITAGGVLSAADAMALHAAASALAFAAGALMLWKATPAPVRVARPRTESKSWWISICRWHSAAAWEL
jgi:O-antigen/teichoic acid export membrane protein